MTSVVKVLLDSFRHEAEQARAVISVAKTADLDYSPGSGLRPLKDLANHLAQIPHMDPNLYSGELDSAEKAQAREKELWRDDIDGILAVFDSGVKSVEERFKNMTEEEFFAKELQPFYETGEARNWGHYMPEFSRHIAMHKIQLWMYLRLSGLDVDMMTYYGVVK